MNESKLYRIVKHGRTFYVREMASGWCLVGELKENRLEWGDNLINKEEAMRRIWQKCGSTPHEYYHVDELEYQENKEYAEG